MFGSLIAPALPNQLNNVYEEIQKTNRKGGENRQAEHSVGTFSAVPVSATPADFRAHACSSHLENQRSHACAHSCIFTGKHSLEYSFRLRKLPGNNLTPNCLFIKSVFATRTYEMNKALPRVSSPLPAKSCHPTYSNPNSPDKLFLKSDCFGLGSFIPAYDLHSEVGDLIQIDRVLYTDWALYVGNGNVVHVSGVDMDNNEIPSDTAIVRLSSLIDVAGISGVRVNNKSVGAKERGLEALALDEVLQNCYSDLEKQVGFNMLTRNSEHYVTEWKYGKGWSDQAAVTMSVMKTLTTDCNIGHNVLVSGLNAVLNSPGSPIGRSTPNFSSSPVSDEKQD